MNRRDFLKSFAVLLSSYKLISPFSKTCAFTDQLCFMLPLTTLYVGENEAVIYCQLSQPVNNGELIISKDGEIVQTLVLSSETQHHLIPISDLEPSSMYQARIEVDGQSLPYLTTDEEWGEISFRTQPYEWPIRFAALGDSGFGEETTATLADHIAQREIDFFMHLGDVVYFYDQYEGDFYQNWAQKYYLPFKDILRHVPHYPTLGNHDREAATILEGQSFYHWAFPSFNESEAYEGLRQWYSFAANDVQFLSLNSQVFYTDRSRREHDEWLDERLAEDGFRAKIPFFHIPFWTSGTVHQNDGLPVAQTWEGRFVDHADQIGVVLNGHSHLYERFFRNNVHYITSGGGSSTIYSHGDSVGGSQAVFSVAHYILVEIYQTRIVVQAYDVNNELFDEAEWDI